MGHAEVWQKGDDVAFIALGSMAHPAFEAAQILLREKIYATVINARFIKPLDDTLILDVYRRVRVVIVIEEGVVRGGFGGAVLETLASNGCLWKDPRPVKCLGFPNEFITFDKRASLLERYGLTPLAIADVARNLLNR